MTNRLEASTDEISSMLDLLEKSLPHTLDAFGVSRKSKLPWKALLYREVLIWRMVELGRGAVQLFDAGCLVAAIVLTRAAVETSAALWYLCSNLDDAVASDDVADVDDYLMKMVMGTATGESAIKMNDGGAIPRPIRIRDFLKRVERDVEGFSHWYGVLSEYAHPNWAGTSLVYSQHDRSTLATHFGRNIRNANATKRIGTTNLSISLEMFHHSYNRIAELIPAFVKLCESRPRRAKKEQ